MSQPQIFPSQPRTTAQIKFSNGQVLEGPLNTTIETFVKAANFPPEPIPVACLVEGEIRELTYHANRDLNVHVLTLADGDGMRVYRRSLAFLLVAVAAELFPDVKITIDYGLNFGGLYCEVEDRPPFTEPELKNIEARMWELVQENAPIVKERIPVEDAKKIFEASGANSRLNLLKARRKSYLTTYKLGNFRGYMHGYKVPSTGYLRIFALDPYYKGFVLRYPRINWPNELQPRVNYPKLINVFDEYGTWMRKLGIRSVGKLNEVVRTGDMLETILVAEALQEQRIAQIATLITSVRHRVKLVLISGPSSAGKTTFSKRLAIQLLAHGIRPMAVALDDFFVNRHETPRDEDGDFDYESLYALNLALFNKTLLELMQGGSVTMPQYNFFTGRNEPGETISISNEHMILIEGIHGMNPELVTELPAEKIFRVYVSAITQLNLDRHNRIPTTDTRLIRRIIRDARHRGYTAKDTILRWPKVRQGEYTWIFPYQENADIMFNSALVYELAVMKPLVEPLLLQIEPGKLEHIEAKRLLSFLQWFEPCASDLVPDNSLLREFIGGSVLRTYKPGEKL